MIRRNMTKRQTLIRNIAALFVGGAILTPGMAPEAQAQLYWDSNGTGIAGAGPTPNGTWGVDAFWNTSSTGLGGTLTATTTALNDVFFSAGTDAVSAYAISLNSATQNARLVTFEDGTATLNTGTLSLGGGGGLTVTTGAVTGATISSGLTISGNNTFNIAASRTLTLSSGTFTRNAGATFNVLSTGTVNTTMTNLAAGSLVNDIIGPWASFNTGVNTTYATIDVGNNIVGLTYAASPAGGQGTLVTASTAVTDTTGNINYSLSAAGTLGTSASINTLRYTGAAGTLTTATAFTTNGILNAGTGLLTIAGNVTIGSTQQLVLNAANSGITISNVIANNGAGPSTLIATGTGTTTLSGTNTYSGGTVINAGTLSALVQANLGSGSVTINTGGQLTTGSGAYAQNMTLNGGTLNIASDGFTNSNLSGTITLSANSTISSSNTNSGVARINGPMTGAGGFTKTGNGGLQLNGANDYSGPTIVNGAASSGITVKSSLYANDTTKWTPANITVASGNTLLLNVGGAGEFTMAQANTMFSQLSTGVNNNGLRAGSTIGVDSRNAAVGTYVYSGLITDSTGTGGGAVNFKHTGKSGTVAELTGANTYSGQTIVDNNATLRVSSFNSVFTNAGLGTVRSASSSLGAPTTIPNGVIHLGSAGSLSNIGNTFGGGNLAYTGTGETTDRVLSLNAGSALTYTLDHSGTGHLKFIGGFATADGRGIQIINLQGSTTGTGEISAVIPNVNSGAGNTIGITKSGTSTWTLSGANTYSGNTTVSGGKLIITNPLALQNSAYVTTGSNGTTIGIDITSGLSSGTLTIGGFSGAVSLASAFTAGYGSVTDMVLNVSGTQTYTGNITGVTGTLTKNGIGTQILGGTNSFTGTTTIRGGTLTIGNGTTGSLNGTTGTDLTFTNTGGFNRHQATGSTQGMGALTINAGDATITSTASGANNAATLTFASLAARPAGVTANFVLATNTSTTNKILLTTATNAPLVVSGSNDPGIIFGGTEYARYDATNGFRAVNYGTDNNALATVATGATIGSVADATKDVKITGAITAQTSDQINTLNLGANNLTFQATASTLSVNGILSSTGSIVNGTAASSIQPAVAGGEIVIYNSGTMSIAPNIVNNISASSVTKSGAGQLTLSGTSTYTGGTVLNQGILLTTADANLGSGGGVTVNGTSTWNMSTATPVTYNRNLTITDGAVLTITSGNGGKTISGVFAGNGSLNWATTTDLIFSNPNNTFSGAITSSTGNSTGYGLGFASIGDAPGAGLINLVGGQGTFRWLSASGTTTTLANRQFAISNAGAATISALGTTAASNLVINKDLLTTGAAGARTLTLAGTNTGNNTFAGLITDGVGSPVSISKAEAGTWILSGANTYTGTTTISAGTLAGIGANAFGNTPGISIAGAGTLSLRGDSSTIFANSNVTTSASGSTINVNQATIAGTGAKAMTIGTLGTTSVAATYQVNFTGANNTSLNVGAVTGAASTAAATVTLDNAIASTGTLTLASYTSANTAGGENLTFSGAGLTTVTGNITPSATTLSLTKNGTGTVILAGSNPYTGVTNVNAGTLRVDGSLTGTSSITLFGSSLVLKTGSAVNVSGALGTSSATGNNITIETGATLNAGSINIPWNTALFQVDGTLASSGNFNVATNTTTTLTGTGNITTTTGSIGNLATTFTINKASGALSYSGLLTLGSTTATHGGIVTLTSGTVNATAGIQLGTGTSTAAQTVNLNGGRLNLGANITALGTGARNLNFNEGIVGASANWNTSLNVNLSGTVAGTTFNTLDSVNNSTARTITLSGAVGGTGKLNKDGAGTLVLTNTNTYSGATTVSAGTLSIGTVATPTGSINTSSGVTINGATANLNYNSSTALTSPITLTAGTISGTGTINTPVTVGGSAVVSPGNSPGIQPYASGLTWANVGTYTWEVNNWTNTPTAGTDFDQIQVTGGLNIAGLTAGTFPTNTFKIDINGLTAGNVIGAVPGFSSTLGRSWTILTSDAISGAFAANLFTLDTTNFAAANIGGSFSLTNSGNDLILNFNPATGSGNNSQILITSTPTTSIPATGVSTKNIALGNIFVGGASTTGSETITKTGGDATTYGVATSGDVASTTFVNGSTTVSGTITLANATSGSKLGTVTIDNLATDSFGGGLGSADGNDVITVTQNVFQTAALTGAATGGNLNLTNAASTDGGQRAGITITGITLGNAASDNRRASNFATPTLAGGGVVGNATNTNVTATVGNYSLKADRLNNATVSYRATATAVGDYTDVALAGLADPTIPTMAIIANQTGALSTPNRTGVVNVYGSARLADIATGDTLAGYSSTVAAAAASGPDRKVLGTTATILAGTATTDMSVSMAWRVRGANESSSIPANNDAGSLPNGYLISDVVNLSGVTGTYVLQMNYNEALLGVDAPSIAKHETDGVTFGRISLAWNDNGTWTNAVDGNTGGTNQFVLRGYTPGDEAVLGRWGVDTVNNVAWAVLNHNSEFAVIPEPSTLVLGGLALLGFAGVGLRRRRMAK